VGFNVQPTRVRARQGLHGNGVITEVGRRGLGHRVHINQGEPPW
jgi:hypothetical protein